MDRSALRRTFEQLRSYFPSLGASYHGTPVLFMDNSAGAFVVGPLQYD